MKTLFHIWINLFVFVLSGNKITTIVGSEKSDKRGSYALGRN